MTTSESSLQAVDFAREFWYIACPSSRLGESPVAARVLDHDIALCRVSDTTVVALIDRCCHRGAKLSLGRATGGHFACGYHGWQFDASGSCVHVPSLCAEQAIPRDAKVRAFPCVEQDGYIWVWTGEGSPEPERPMPVPNFATSGWRQGSSECRCSAAMLLENQFDCAHPAFAHEGTHPSFFFSRIKGLREYAFEVRSTDDGLHAFFPPTEMASDPVPAESNSRSTFRVPNRVELHQKMLMVDFYLILHIIPTGPDTCRLEYLQRDKKVEGVVWIKEETRLMEQDRVLLESAQAALADTEATELSVPADYVTLQLRRQMRALSGPDWRSSFRKLESRRLVKVRG